MTALFTLRQALQWLPEGVPFGDTGVAIGRVHTDTRSLQPDDLFVALKGDTYDGNRFLADAKARGAVAALCHPGSDPVAAGLPAIEVPDSKRALGQLGAAWRAQFQLPVIAVTGSNGKTTVTQMVAAILRAFRPDTMLATQGNFNNDIGVPLTLLRLDASREIAVLELGMNHPGEIALLAGMARPNVALVNNAQREHLEFMGTIEAVARENGAVITALPADGIAVFPHDDAFAPLWRTLAQDRRVMSFAAQPAASAQADVRCVQAAWTDGAWNVHAHTPAGDLHFRVRIAGQHNVHNALAAATCALAAGVPLDAIRHGLEAFEPVKGRSRASIVAVDGRTITLVDDSYNANPDSVQAALEMLAALPAPRLMVLGDMGEVGAEGPLFHAQAGSAARSLGIEHLFTLGELSVAAAAEHPGGRHFADMPALLDGVLDRLPHTASVLVKGSKFMRMGRVVEAIAHRAQPTAASSTASRKDTPPCC